MTPKEIKTGQITIGKGNLVIMAGPCVLEDREMAVDIALEASAICRKIGLEYLFKASFDKANRTSISSFRGPGLEKGLKWLQEVKDKAEVPVLTDIHEPWQAEPVSQVADILQIPAFLCRQTDIVVAAAQTGKTVNIKKGQFLSAEAMKFAVNKVRESGNEKIVLTERGTTFGYQDLVVDYRGIPKMKQFNVPVALDITHSLQQPNQASGVTGGQPGLIETIARAGIAVGADGIFIETHPNPAEAKSDGANMLKLEHLEPLLEKLSGLYKFVQKL